jgi:hypothetical protein
MSEKAKETPAQSRSRIINNIVDQPGGAKALKILMDICGYDGYTVTQNPQTQEINIMATIYNDARRGVWIDIRNLLTKENRRKIENEDI